MFKKYNFLTNIYTWEKSQSFNDQKINIFQIKNKLYKLYY